MKRVITSALVLTLLASSAAMAQEQGRGGGGGPRGGGERQAPQGGGNGGGGFQRQDRGDRPTPTQAAPQAQSEQIRPRGYGRDDQRFTPRPQQGGGDQRGSDRPDQRGPDQRGPDQRPDPRPDRPGQTPGGGFNGRPGADNRPGDNRPGDNRPGDNRPGQPSRPNDNRWDNRGDQRWNNPGDNRWDDRGPNIRPGDQRFRDRDRGRQQWDQRTWRPSYRAPQRFRGPVWRPPVGFYAYNWQFGDYLPRTWFGSSYYLNWVAYGLPMPPIGAEWVRSGNDAILVDTWSGRVLSVYYDLFW